MLQVHNPGLHIVADQDFENAMYKIQAGRDPFLFEQKKEAVKVSESGESSIVEVAAEGDGEPESSDFSDSSRSQSIVRAASYIPIHWIRPTTNMVERFFSLAKFVSEQ